MSVGYETLDTSLETPLIKREDLGFDGKVTVLLYLGELGIHEVMLGDALVLTMPEGFGTLQVTPSDPLSNRLSNETTLAPVQKSSITAKKVSLTLPDYATLGIPAVVIDLPETSNRSPIVAIALGCFIVWPLGA